MNISKVNNILDSINEIDTVTYDHLERTSMFTFALAKELNLKPVQLEQAYFAGLLHDIGVLSSISREKKECAKMGSVMLKLIDDFNIISKVIKHLHDFDSQEESYITLLAEITALSSEYDELKNIKGLSHEETLHILEKSGFKNAMLRSFDDVLKKEELI